MRYIYYPGCSLEGSSVEYDISTRALLASFDIGIEPLDDWTCCGASAAEARSMLLSFVLPARNLALAEKMNVSDQVLVPCSACYLNLKKTEQAVQKDKPLLETINQVLAEEGLALKGTMRVRHLLDVLSREVDLSQIEQQIKNRMDGITAAPYYGCQCLRPYVEFDDPEEPHSMDNLIRVTGAIPLAWDMAAQCCGASHTSTKPEAGLALVKRILRSAKEADVIVTVCPMCQMNLENYQKKLSRETGENLEKPVLFLPQFLGLALGNSRDQVRLDLNLSNTKCFMNTV